MKYKRILVAGTALTTAMGVSAQTPSASVTPAVPASASPSAPITERAAPAESSEVLIVADRGPQQSIDRKSYTIRQGPAAEIATGMDVMQDLPSVSVSAAGQIELLGNANVKILIDGRPVPDALTVLRGLGASQIARVEVITNPSAQFPSDGTAGIINVITKRSARDGIGGTLAAGVDSRGAITGRIGPTWTKDKWTLSTNLGRFANYQPQQSTITRQQLAGVPDGISNRNEDNDFEWYHRGYFMRSQAVYRPAERRSLSAAFSASKYDGDQTVNNLITPGTGGAGFLPILQTGGSHQGSRAGNLAIDYRADGTKPNQNLTIAGSASTFRFVADNIFRERNSAGAIADVNAGTRVTDKSTTLKVDYNTPLGADRLSVGGQWDWRERSFFDFGFGGGLLTAPRNQATDFEGAYSEYAAYVTYQTSLGNWKVLPGLRIQYRDYTLDIPGGGGPSEAQFFPSLHVERKLSARFTGVLSYSRRIAWPDIELLTPAIRQLSPTFAITGDPNLQPETTDAFEGRVSYGGKVHSFDLTLYNRITHDTFDRRIEQSNGLLVAKSINAGRKLDQGVELAFRGRVIPNLRYTLTGNLTAVTRDIQGVGRQRDAQYRGKLQLDYTSGKAGDPGYDQVTLNLRYEGPVQNFQTRRASYVDGDVAWTHRYTPKLSSVMNLTGLFGGYKLKTDLRTPFLYERRVDETTGLTARFTLTYQLGNSPQPLPPQQAAPGGPPVPGV